MERYTITVKDNFITMKDNSLGEIYKGECYKKNGKVYVKSNSLISMKLISKHWNKQI